MLPAEDAGVELLINDTGWQTQTGTQQPQEWLSGDADENGRRCQVAMFTVRTERIITSLATIITTYTF